VIQLHIDRLCIVSQTGTVFCGNSPKGGEEGADTGGETKLAVPAREVRLARHLLVEVDGAEASGRGNDAEQVEDPVQLNF